jgi:hypothetical protein
LSLNQGHPEEKSRCDAENELILIKSIYKFHGYYHFVIIN